MKCLHYLDGHFLYAPPWFKGDNQTLSSINSLGLTKIQYWLDSIATKDQRCCGQTPSVIQMVSKAEQLLH